MQIENLDHLGLIAGVIDEIGLVELTNEELGTHKFQQISPGQVVKAMILNALGFISAPLYLFSEFFSGKPVEHLLGVGVRAEQLNDDRLGRVLDELFDYGTTTFFLKAAMQAAQRFEVKRQQFHLASTSFALDGEYQSEAAEGAATGGEAEPTPIRICRGYSRDHRPELKQFLVNLVCSNDGGIPLWFQVGSGNETDSQTFAVIAKAFAEQWQVEGLMVMDAAFYSEPNLKQMGDIQWLTRVPQTLSAAQSLIESDETALLERPCSLKGYRLWEKTEGYGGVEQRWILVESQQRRQSDPRWQASFLKQRKPCSGTPSAACPLTLSLPNVLPVAPNVRLKAATRLSDSAIRLRRLWSEPTSLSKKAVRSAAVSFWQRINSMPNNFPQNGCWWSTNSNKWSSEASASSKTRCSLPAVWLSKSRSGWKP